MIHWLFTRDINQTVLQSYLLNTYFLIPSINVDSYANEYSFGFSLLDSSTPALSRPLYASQ